MHLLVYFLLSVKNFLYLFIEYFCKRRISPFKNLIDLFARKEYQQDKFNLYHGHLMAQLDWLTMTEAER